MVRQTIWKGESRSHCTACGATFSCEAVISKSSKKDERWILGAPPEVGDYWIILSSNKMLPVRAEFFIKAGEDTLLISDRSIPLGQIARRVLYHKTFVLPEVPEALQEKGV